MSFPRRTRRSAARQTVIAELRASGGAEEDVGRLNVTVNDALGMTRRKGLEDLESRSQHPLLPDPFLRNNKVVQRPSPHEFHDEARARCLLLQSENLHNAVMIDQSGTDGLVAKQCKVLRVIGSARLQDLERDLRVSSSVPGAEDTPAPSLAEHLMKSERSGPHSHTNLGTASRAAHHREKGLASDIQHHPAGGTRLLGTGGDCLRHQLTLTEGTSILQGACRSR